MKTEQEISYPSLVKRIQSSVIDFVVLMIVMAIFAKISSLFVNFPTSFRIGLMASLILYEPICMSFFGYTVGNYVLGLRVRKIADESQNINIFQALLRYVVKLLLGWLAFLSIHSNEKKRAIHDFVAGTVMVKLP
jgi:uncharacterized RDD family membrane protein YckC